MYPVCKECGSECFKVESYHDKETKYGSIIVECNCECQKCWHLYQYDFPNEKMMREAELRAIRLLDEM